MPSRAGLYVRQSHTIEDSASIELQIEVGRQTSERFGVPIVREFIEPPSTSAFKDRGRARKEYANFLESIRTHEIDCIITYLTDRLNRGGLVSYAVMVEAIEDAGHDPNHFVLGPGGWISELELSMRAAMDREEAIKISRRMRDIHARAARDGRPRGCRAYGYEYSKVTKEMTVVTEEAEVIQECVRRVSDGETPYSLVQDLNRRELRAAGGNPWKTNTLIRVLQAPRLAGLRTHLGEVVATGTWEPIISIDQHRRMVALTASRHSHGSKKAARTFALVGFLTCGKCGAPLRSMTSSKAEQKRRRYVCRGGELNGCGGIQIKAEFVEEAVRDKVIEILTEPTVKERLLAAAPQPDDTARQELVNSLHDIAAARERLTDLAVDGAITRSEVRRKTSELNDRQATIEARLAGMARASTLPTLPLGAESLTELWDRQGVQFQRNLISLLIREVEVRPARRGRPGYFDSDRLEWSFVQ